MLVFPLFCSTSPRVCRPREALLEPPSFAGGYLTSWTPRLHSSARLRGANGAWIGVSKEGFSINRFPERREGDSSKFFAPASFLPFFFSPSRLEPKRPAHPASGGRFDLHRRWEGRAGSCLGDEREIEAMERAIASKKSGVESQKNSLIYLLRRRRRKASNGDVLRLRQSTCGWSVDLFFLPLSFSRPPPPPPPPPSSPSRLKQNRKTTRTSSTPQRRPASTSPTRAARARARRARARSSRAASTSLTSPSSTTTRSARASC